VMIDRECIALVLEFAMARDARISDGSPRLAVQITSRRTGAIIVRVPAVFLAMPPSSETTRSRFFAKHSSTSR